MSPSRILILLIFIFFCGMTAFATTFTVTSNADSGPGTLRDAIAQASANGTATTDNIVFNIADLSAAGRTITLLSELPALSSNLILDGTTQPGPVFGISNTKVKLFLADFPSTGYFTALLVDNATNVEIYGLFVSFPLDPREIEDLYGIRIKSSSNVTIGAKGKGNVINGWFLNITNSYWNYYSDHSNNITIKGNMLGVTEFGAPAPFTTPNPVDISMSDTYNLVIGGTDPAEGNQMDALYSCVGANYFDPAIPGTFFVKMWNNLIEVDPTGMISYQGSLDDAVGLNGTNIATTDTEVVKTEVVNNTISKSGEGSQLAISSTNHLVKVMGNKIGTDITGTKQIGTASSGLYISGCYKVLVGSDDPADVNYFSGNGSGVAYGGTAKALITKNSFFCNGLGISILGSPNPLPFINITTYTAGLIGGNANPLARIELFQNHDCPGPYQCQGKTYIATVYADNTGNWFYTGPQTPSMIATATTVDSATSEFPVPQISTGPPTVIPSTCGKNDGSIMGYKISNGPDIQWIDQAGNKVGSDTNLVNIGPGTYTLIVSFGPSGCQVSSSAITVPDLHPPMPLNTSLLNPTCGQTNGQITVSNDLTGLTAKWINTLGDTLTFPNGPYFPPGAFSLVTYPTGDYSCAQTYGPYNLINQGGPSVDISAVQVSPASCNLSNGNITAIQFDNVTGSPVYRWVDASGRTVGTTADLVNAPQGQYQLKFKDGSACDTITTDFNIPQLPMTALSATFNTHPETCNRMDGSISIGTLTPDPPGYSLEWVATGNGHTIGTGQSISNLASGSYSLYATDGNGCRQLVANTFLTGDPAPVINGATVDPNICSENNGSVTQLSVQGSAPFSYSWYDANGQSLNQGQELTHQSAGSYYVVVTDANNCSSTSPFYVIKDSSLSVDPPEYQGLIILKGNNAILTVLNPASGDYLLYSTQDGISTPGSYPDQQNTTGDFTVGPIYQDTTVYITLKKAGDCLSVPTAVHIKMVETLTVSMPNAFTPNGDGNNDQFRVKYPQVIKTFHMTVFNRYGQRIFDTTDPYAGWDGTFNGSKQPMGDYVWIMTYQDILGNTKRLSGSVILIR